MTKGRRFARFYYVALASLTLLSFATLFEASRELKNLDEAEQGAVDSSFDLAMGRIQAYLGLLRSRIEAISYRELELIRAVIARPDDFDAADRLMAQVRDKLPDAFAVTVASPEGEPITADFDGLVGEHCRANIRHFAERGGDFQIRVHPNPLGYHFDVMVPLEGPTHRAEGIFFVSFHLDRLATLLAEAQLGGHELMLLLDGEPGLIEVHPRGGRDAMPRPIRLAPDEIGKLMRTGAIPGTAWQLVDLPGEHLLAHKAVTAVARYAGYLVLLLMMIAAMVIALRAEARYRATLERANLELEDRVAARTAELEAANARTSSIIDNASDAIITIGQDQRITLFNPGAERMFGYRTEEVIDKPLSLLLPEDRRELHMRLVQRFGDEKERSRMKDGRSEIQGRRRDGSLFPAEATVCKTRIGGDLYFTAFMRDISERKAAEARIQQLALTDPLTGVANRRDFDRKLADAVAHARRFGYQVGLMLLDLDDFKPVNDTYGHHVGDELLKHLAQLLTAGLRKVDAVARFGGDEFAIILSGIKQLDDLHAIAEGLLDRIARPVTIRGHRIQVGASIGVTLCPREGADLDLLLIRADKALYAAKRAGKHNYQIYQFESATPSGVAG